MSLDSLLTGVVGLNRRVMKWSGPDQKYSARNHNLQFGQTSTFNQPVFIYHTRHCVIYLLYEYTVSRRCAVRTKLCHLRPVLSIEHANNGLCKLFVAIVSFWWTCKSS